MYTKVLNKLKKAFTLTEMIIVVTIIGILMMWITTYIGWADEKTKIIEAQWCAASLWWFINNYIFYTLTSKTLKLEDNTIVSPNFYLIWLSWGKYSSSNNCSKNNAEGSSKIFCKDIVFSYMDWDGNIHEYDKINVSNSCRQAKPKLWFYREWDSSNNLDVKYIQMNKWFSPVAVNEMNVFYLKTASNNKELLWNIIIVLCSDDECTTWKQVAKWSIDWRSQTISLKRCRFYNENDPSRCETREL